MTQSHATDCSSRLVTAIKRRLDGLSLLDPVLRVSVADEPVWEKSKKGDFVHVRWMCWSVEDGGMEVVEPNFEVLSHLVTRSQLAQELPAFFDSLKVIVDNDIGT